MKSIANWNPLKSAVRWEPTNIVDDYFRNFGLSPLVGPLASPFEMPGIRMDVSESDKTYAIKADVPGVKKEDIDVSIDGRHVAITATLSNRVEKKGESSLYAERSEGRIYRSLTLPSEVDTDGAKAHYEDGVLDLTLPKKNSGNGRRLKIS